MSRNGSGTFSLLVNSWNPATGGVSATTADWQALINDVATALTGSLAADGQTALSGNLNFNSNKATNLASASATGHAIVYGQSSWSLGAGTITGALTLSGAVTASGGATISTAAWNFPDSFLKITGSSDATKIAVFEADGITTGTTRTITVPDRDITLNNLTAYTASLGADVNLNNTANYFTGPSVSQGTAGTWFVSGTVTLSSSGAGDNFDVKLWDGTTVIASTRTADSSTNTQSVSLSGYITSPAGDLRISVKDPTSINGKILFNATGNSMDSTITAVRIG